MKHLVWLSLVAGLCLLPSLLQAQEDAPYKSKPKGHEKNQQLATRAYESNLTAYADSNAILVLPGLVADQKKKRVEVWVERTAVGRDAPCEFTIIAESSDHAYEALLICFAKPSDVHRALQFIGTEPGESFDPESLRHWAKGESFVLSLLRTNEPPLRLERLLVDRRTGQTLREAGFMFTGSRRVPASTDPEKTVYADDESTFTWTLPCRRCPRRNHEANEPNRLRHTAAQPLAVQRQDHRRAGAQQRGRRFRRHDVDTGH